MEFTKDTKLKDILKEYPWLLDEAIKMNPKFKVAKTPIGKALINKADLAEASKRTGIDVDTIIAKHKEFIAEHEK